MTEAVDNKTISYSNLEVFKQAQDAFNRNTFTRIVKVENKEDIPANANPNILYLVEETEDNIVGGGGGSSSSIIVDSVLSPTSKNPVQNKVIYQKLQEIETSSISRDEVQNMISTTLGDIEAQLQSI